MLTARATTRATVTIETADCTVMAVLAQRVSGMTSVGLKAAALVNDRYRSVSYTHLTLPTKA